MNKLALAEKTDAQAVTVEPMAAPESTALTPMQMAYQLIARGADLGSVKEFLTMSKELAADEARREFEQAVANAKAEIPVIQKNRHVGFTSRKEGAAKTDYWHEDFAQVARTVDPILSKFGLSYRFEADQEGAQLSVTCILAHRAGHSTRTTLKAGNDVSGNKNPIQGVGSTATFLQRYTLKLALGLSASKDDDAKSATETSGVISEDQVDELQSLIDKAVAAKGGDRAAWLTAFLDYMKVDALLEIPIKDFGKAKAEIEHAIKQGAK